MIIMLKVIFTILLVLGYISLVSHAANCLMRYSDDLLPEMMVVLTVLYGIVVSLLVFGMFAKYINN